MLLSICIPTYNRAPFLRQLFDSILAQTDHGCALEIVVSDNRSTDDTEDVIAAYRARFPRLVYHCASENRGYDRNLLKAVELASGDFCWLMGSDDIVEPGGVAEVEKAIATTPDIAGLSVRNNSYNLAMTAPVSSFASGAIFPQTTTVIGAENIFLRLGSYIGFLSGNVIDRQLWKEVTEQHDLQPFCNSWIHSYVIGCMIQRRPRWLYLAYPGVGWRSGNDSFLSEGEYRRLEIDVSGYDQVVSELFGVGSNVHKQIVRSSFPHARHRILRGKVKGASPVFFKQAYTLLLRHYGLSPRFWLTCYPLFLVPSALPQAANRVRRLLKGME